MKAHRDHEVVELDKLATAKELSDANRVIAFHNEQVGKRVENVNLALELAKTAVERIVSVSPVRFLYFSTLFVRLLFTTKFRSVSLAKMPGASARPSSSPMRKISDSWTNRENARSTL